MNEKDIYRAVLMVMTTLGHPRAAAEWKWANSA
jgi:hypothetical protein